MDFLTSFLLGLLQGITEFLPISSSGHLVLAQSIFIPQKQNSFLLFGVVVHAGTLCSIVIFYRYKIWSLLVDIIRPLSLTAKKKGIAKEGGGLMLAYIIVATLPAALVGFFLKDMIELLLHQPWIVSLMLVLNGTILLCTRWAPRCYKNVSFPLPSLWDWFKL